MNRTKIALVTLLAVVVARAADIATTLHFNPSLSWEANPVTIMLGRRATGMVVSNIVAVLLLVIAPLYVYWRFPPAPMASRPANLREFIGLQFYGRVMGRWEFVVASLFHLPRNWLQVVRLMGFAGAWTIVFASFLAVLSWWAVVAWKWHFYRQIRHLWVIGKYPVSELVVDVLFFICIALYHSHREFSACRERNVV